MKKMKKWQIWTAAGAAVLVIGTTSVMMFSHPNSPNQEVANETPMVQTVKDGSIASSVLLTGKVTADQEQYVYFDGTKGDLQSILVNVGDQVTAGQAIVQYSSTEAQTAYDAAVRTVNKADRQLNDLMTNGVSVDTTGDDEEDAKSASQAQRTVDSQASDLRDARADAVDNMNKAKALLDATIVKSSIDGTVVEVNKDVSKSTTGTNQTLVHIVSNPSTIWPIFLKVKKWYLLPKFIQIKPGQERFLMWVIIQPILGKPTTIQQVEHKGAVVLNIRSQ